MSTGWVDWNRHRHHVGRKVTRVLKGDLNVWHLIGGTFTFVAFIVVASWPSIRPLLVEKVKVSGLALVLLSVLPPTLAGFWIKWSERRKRTMAWSAQQRRRRRTRKIAAGNALRTMASKPASKWSVVERRQIIDELLSAAAFSVESILHCDENLVTANLLLFDRSDVTKMYTAGRSVRDRTSVQKYDRETLLAYACVKSGKIEVIDDTAKDSRCTWMDKAKKKYKTIAAIPLTLGKEGYGAITLDSPEEYLFSGKADDIALQLEPYLAVLLKAIDRSAPCLGCDYEPSQNQ